MLIVYPLSPQETLISFAVMQKNGVLASGSETLRLGESVGVLDYGQWTLDNGLSERYAGTIATLEERFA